jgi:hypothetical protein
MANVNRKWLPPMLIAVAAAASTIFYGRLPALVGVRFDELLPFDAASTGDPAPRWVALYLMPMLALVVWCGFRWAPTAAGQRLGRRMFRNAPETVTQSEQFQRFGKAYDSIVLSVVLILLGLHAAVLVFALERPVTALRIVAIILGASLVLMGNIMPRVRPNWVAGIRTKRTLADPLLWRNTHRAFGAALVVSGIATAAVGLIVPRYVVMLFVGSLLASCLVGGLASVRKIAR